MLAAQNAMLLADGVFLFRPELRAYWDFRIFLAIDIDEVLRRAAVRDAALFGSADATRARYLHKYIPGQQLYSAEANPRSFADLVIDNSQPQTPHLV